MVPLDSPNISEISDKPLGNSKLKTGSVRPPSTQSSTMTTEATWIVDFCVADTGLDA